MGPGRSERNLSAGGAAVVKRGEFRLSTGVLRFESSLAMGKIYANRRMANRMSEWSQRYMTPCTIQKGGELKEKG